MSQNTCILPKNALPYITGSLLSYFRHYRFCFGCFLIALFSFGESKAQDGIPIIEYFGTEDYNAGIQNYAITQDNRGVIYVANNLGLLEYDGESWKRYQIEKGTKIRSVYTDPSGRVYIGAQNELGYFFPSVNGEYTYFSMSHLLPEEYSNFEDIWNIYSQDNQLVFTASKQLMFFDDEKDSLTVLPLSNATAFSFRINDNLFTQFAEDGLKILESKEWKSTGYGKFFEDRQVTGLTALNKDYHLIATRDDGLFLVNENEVTSWAPVLRSEFVDHKINVIRRLRNGSIAIGTNTNGLYLLDENGELIDHFTKDLGLENRAVLSIYEDSFGYIWVGMNNGIAKIEWQAPFSYINEDLGLQGTGYSAYSKGNYTYYGTDNGLFYSIKGSRNIIRIGGIEGQVHNIQNISGDLLVAGHFGAFKLEQESAVLISDRIGWWEFVETTNPDLAIAGNYDGLYLFERKDGVWSESIKYEDFSESSRVMEFDNSGILWMTHGYKGVYNFNFSEDLRVIDESNYYGQRDGFPSNLLINVFRIGQKLIFAAEQGIYSYDPSSDSFVPDTKFNAAFDLNNHIREIAEDSFGNLYFIATDKSGVSRLNNWGEYEMDTILFYKIHRSLNDDLESISIIDDENILFAAKEGFIHLNTATPRPSYDINLLIRSVRFTESDSLIFGGNFIENNRIINIQPQSEIHEFPYRYNSLVITYSASDYNQSETLYRFMLEGFNRDWSDWTNRSEKEYSNLREGSYTFRVEAKDVYGNLSNIQEYTFVVLPPWYRTWIAYLGYLLITILGLALSVILGQRKVKREKNLIIDKQKVEIEDLALVSQSSKEEIQKLRNEKLKSEIKHKNKELATKAMHLIDKNSFIGSIKTNLDDIIKKEEQASNKHQLNRIIRNIEQNIDSDNDWEQFEVHFDEVHEEFLKKLRSDHPQITPQEIKLSAYLRMNMTTKEIANLLRISVRGVEIGRYRLRKKLGLPKEANLVDHMMNY